MDIVWRICLNAGALLIAGCEGATPSDESAELQEKLAPQISKWAESPEASLRVNTVLDTRKYDAICIVPEYNCMDQVKYPLVAEITSYHSSFGKCIPEGAIALMIIDNNEAHAALINLNNTQSDVLSYGTCAVASKAVLTKSLTRVRLTPVILIEER